MRPTSVVRDAPALDGASSIGKLKKLVLIQALLPESPVETLDVCILHRFTRLDEVQHDMILICARVERTAIAFRPSPIVPASRHQYAWPIEFERLLIWYGILSRIPGPPNAAATIRMAFGGPHGTSCTI